MQARKLHPVFAAEVTGVASGNPTKKYRLGAYMFDASNLDADGALLPADHPRRTMRAGDALWHTDSSFNPMPTKWSMLRAVAVPPEGGNTEFADCRAAYDDLDDETRSTIEGLAAEHSLWTSRRKAGLEEISEDLVRGLPPVIQPLVRSIPRSGRKAFYVGAHAGRVYGMPFHEGQALLERLTGFATQPKYVYVHDWRVGDIVIWDNRAVLHRAGKFDGTTEHRRDMRRTTVDEFQPSWARLG